MIHRRFCRLAAICLSAIVFVGAARCEAQTGGNDGVVAAARERAELMHDIYEATLHVLHERYFHGDRAIVPARAMQDIFAQIERQSKTEARWISASTRPMSIDHEPKSEFEKKAAREIAAGAKALETVENGFYRRAGAIPLSGGCVGCHGGLLQAQSTRAKFAGLVISVPLGGGDAAQPAAP